jgi:hypothetical protein
MYGNAAACSMALCTTGTHPANPGGLSHWDLRGRTLAIVLHARSGLRRRDTAVSACGAHPVAEDHSASSADSAGHAGGQGGCGSLSGGFLVRAPEICVEILSLTRISPTAAFAPLAGKHTNRNP